MAIPPHIKTPENDSVEKEFRKKHLWHSFTSAAYGALGGASFFGALIMIAQGVVGIAAKVGGIAELGQLATSGAILTNPLTLAAVGGLIVFGLACTYMSQREATELQVARDEHAACQNAKQINTGLSQNIEYAQNQRADGKKWADVSQANPSHQVTIH